MLVASGTEFMFAIDQETNPLPLTVIVAGSRAELIVVGETELSRGTGVDPVHSIRPPQAGRHDTAITTTTIEMQRALRDICAPPRPLRQHPRAP